MPPSPPLLLAVLVFYGRCDSMRCTSMLSSNGAAKTLFDGSEETPGLKGLGIIPGMVGCFDPTKVKRLTLASHNRRLGHPER